MKRFFLHTIGIRILTILAVFAYCLPVHGQFGPGPGPDEAIAYTYINATTKLIRGDMRNAMLLFEEVVELQPENHAAWYHMAKIAFAQREYENAIKYSQKAIALEPANTWYKQNLVQAYEYHGSFEEAIEVQKQIINSKDAKAEAYLKLSSLMERTQNFEAVKHYLEELNDKFGPNVEASSKLVEVYIKLGQKHSALSTVENLIRINPFEENYYRIQYELHSELGMKDEAVTGLEELIRINPNNSFGLLTLADHYKETGDLERSDQYLFRAFERVEVPIDGKIEIVQQLLGFVESQPTLVPRIRQLVSIIRTAHPFDAAAFEVQGHVFALDSQADSAANYYRKALEEKPADLELWKRLLYLSYRAENYPSLLSDAENAMDLYPNQAEIVFLFGLASGEMGDADAANYAFSKVRKSPGANAALLATVDFEEAKLLNRSEQYEEADKLFLSALESQNKSEWKYLYAVILSKRGQKLDMARKLLLELVKEKPGIGRYNGSLGRVLYQLDDFSEAEKYLQKATEASPSPTFLEYFGDVLYKLGKKEAAISAWQKALEMGAKDINIESKVNQL